ncbi:hypothetical protein QYE76_065295 [Lolium multiflorum]|uniref:Transposase (putative) gypsy type domain-containing protein n=1 Tax=Lolium multiflorum TaxID=4521 RepID=A0AAD8SAP0_LOLMU|nr:hypothetical protein QYE76_065295 [Lolium multiflorum]
MKAPVERGFSLPPSDFFSEILEAYKLQPHNILPNSILAIANHVSLCEGHLRVKPDLALFQFFVSVKKEIVPQTSSLANSGSIIFKIRPGRIYPHTDRHESVRYWSAGFFYVKDIQVPASSKTLPAFKDGPASETSTWTASPHISESPAIVKMVRQICKLVESGLSGKDLTLSCFTKRIQPLQHRDRLMYFYNGRDDTMCATKDNISSDALDKRLRLDSLEEKDLGTLTQIPHSGSANQETASDAENPEVAGNKPQKMKLKPSPASMPITPVEVPPKPSSSAIPDPKNVINIDNDPIPTADSGKGASSSKPVPGEPEETSAEAPANDAAKKLTLSGAHGTPAMHPHLLPYTSAIWKTSCQAPLHRRDLRQAPISESEHESLQGALKESHENETKLKKDLEDKHAQEMSEMAEKLKTSNNRVKTLATKLKAAEMEAADIDKMIFPLLGFERKKDDGISRTEAYEEAGTSIEDLIEAWKIAQNLSLKKARTKVIDTMTNMMCMVPKLIGDWQRIVFPRSRYHSLGHDEEEYEEEGSGSSAHQSCEESGDGSAKDNTFHAFDEDKPESSE